MADHHASSAQPIKGIGLEGTFEGRGRRVGIVRTRWNTTIIDALVKGARDELARCGVAEKDIIEVQASFSSAVQPGHNCYVVRTPASSHPPYESALTTGREDAAGSRGV